MSARSALRGVSPGWCLHEGAVAVIPAVVKAHSTAVDSLLERTFYPQPQRLPNTARQLVGYQRSL